MKYIFIFIGATILTILDIMEFLITFILNICWDFTITKWEDVKTNEGRTPEWITDKYGNVITIDRPTKLKCDKNIWCTFKRHLTFGTLNEYYK